MIICLVRHGQTDWNSRSLIQGRTDNVLNDTGIKQAELVGEYLKENDPIWDRLISSPLKRAKMTAEVIANKIDYKKEIVLFDGLMERDFGHLEGEVLNANTYDLIFEEKIEGLESKTDLIKRSTQALLEIANKYPNEKILAFSHAQFIKSLIVNYEPNFNFRSLLENSSMNYFEILDNQVKIIKYNIVPKKKEL